MKTMAYESRQLFNFMQGSDISGESAYDIWKRLGNTGSEADFLEFIRTGPQGPKGDPGEAAISYHLLASDAVIKKDLNGVAVPANVTFGSYYLIGTDVVRHNYSGRFVIQESVNGLSWEAKYTSTEDESTITYTPTENAAFIRCTLYSAGDSAVELDVQSVAILSEVKPDDLEVLSATLTNDAHVVATDGNGENGDYSECVTAINVFSGIRDVTAECTFENNACDGLTGEWDLASHTYTVTSLSSDAGYVDIIASYNEVTVTKRFSISKSKFGKSAYEIWLEIPGNEGKTEEDFLNENGKGYTDTAIAAALTESKKYTDEELAKEVTARNDAISAEASSRTSAINTAIANEVTDRNSAIETAKTEANEYTDTEIASAKTAANSYTDQKVAEEVTARNAAIETAKTEANEYTDEQITAAKTTVNSYTDQKVAAEATARDTAIGTAKTEANEYTDTQIAAAKKEANSYTDTAIGNLVGSAPEIMNTIEEVAAAIEEHRDVTDALNAAIGNKANAADLTEHIEDDTVHITGSERTKWNAAETNANSYTDTAIGNLKTEVNGYTDDQITAAKALSDKYTDDKIAAEVTARDNAISAAKEEVNGYTDEQVAAAKTAANTYADTQDNTILANAKEYTDTEIASAKTAANTYADEKVAAEVTVRDNAIDEAKADVNKYTDDKVAAEVTARNEAIEAAKKEIAEQNSEESSNTIAQMTQYTDNKVATAKSEANTYTDEQITATKTASDKYTDDAISAEVTARDTAIGTAKTEANEYTDEQVAAAKTDANSYTDLKVLENSIIKQFPIWGQNNYGWDLVNALDLENSGIYMLKDASNITGFAVVADDNTSKQITLIEHAELYRIDKGPNIIYIERNNTSIKIDATNRTTASDIVVEYSYNFKYIGSKNSHEYIPTDDYNPATKKYVDDSTVQSDWSQTDESAKDYIKNKPTEEDALILAMELGLIDLVADKDGSVYTDNNGLIYSL